MTKQRQQKRILATIPQRAVAIFIDGLIIFAIYFAVAAIVSLTAGSSGLFYFYNSNLVNLGVWFFSFAYFACFESLNQGTPGKHIMGLRVKHLDGRELTGKEAFLRTLLRLVDGFPYFIPYALGAAFASGSDNKQRLGDAVAQSMVVNTRKEQKKHGE